MANDIEGKYLIFGSFVWIKNIFNARFVRFVVKIFFCACVLLGIIILPLLGENPNATQKKQNPLSLQTSPNPQNLQNPQNSPKPSTTKDIKAKLEEIESALAKNDSIWLKRYADYADYMRIAREIDSLSSEVLSLQKTNTDKESINQKKHTIETLQRQLELLKDKSDPFADIIQKPEIPEIPSITNPFAIISGISFVKSLNASKASLESSKKSLDELILLISQKYDLLLELQAKSPEKNKAKELNKNIYSTQIQLLEFQSAQNVLKTSVEVYGKKYDEIHNEIYGAIKKQVLKLGYIALAIFISICIALVLKIIVRRYIAHNERAYTASKIINFFNFTIIIFILLFGYLENVTYLVAVLGFASAGLAIAMKDLFMSLLGWFVIVLSGSVHVGDRIRIQKDGSTYVGDVLDISALRITIYEDVTLTSYRENRRAGRIVFIPNNYVFTNMIANYTHSGMQTVWDGIDFCITFDSNLPKATHIASDIVVKYSRGYTQISKKSVNQMRDRYSLRNANLDVRVYSFIEPNGVKISVWYQTNSYATLALRSTISLEIIRALLAEPDIFIAYDTTKFVQTGNDGFGDKKKSDCVESKEIPKEKK
ncbi:mechanosensitive ion channel domain-containing protein [Helicobacter sp. T3_23-1059]